MSRSKVIQTGKNAIVEYLDLDICYSAKGTKGKWRYASSKARKNWRYASSKAKLKCTPPIGGR